MLSLRTCKLPFMTYGDRLQQAIKERGASRATVAKAAGVSVQAVGQVIRGDTKAFTSENTAKVARALAISPDWLATGEGEMFPVIHFAGAARTGSSASATLTTTTARTESTSDQLLGHLTGLANALERADALTLAQVKPLFSMLFGGADRGGLDAGTIAQRLAELLSYATVQKDGTEKSAGASRGLDERINHDKGKNNDGKGDSASADERKTGHR